MRIACCIHSLSGGGAEHLMAELVNGLAEKHSVMLLTLAAPDSDLYPVDDRVDRVGVDLTGSSRTPIHGLINNFRRIRSLRRALRDRSPDVILSFCDQMNVATLIASRPMRIPVVVAEMSDPRFHPMPMIWRQLRPRVYPRAAAVVAISRASLPTVSQLAGGQAEYIPPAVDEVPETVSIDSPPDGIHRLASVGRLASEKRFDWLIKAFASIASQHPDWRLDIAGGGNLQNELSALVAELEMSDRIRLLGRIPEVWSFLCGADAYASSSLYEGTPLSVLEAMKAGLPIVAVDCDSGINELVESEAEGLITPNSIEDLAVGLDRLLGDPSLRESLAQAARLKAAEYSWPNFVRRYETLLERVAKHSTGARPG